MSDLAEGLLAAHWQTHHGISHSIAWEAPLPAAPSMYCVSFQRESPTAPCLVKGCQGHARIQKNFQIHFLNRHAHDKVVILDEGNRPHL